MGNIGDFGVDQKRRGLAASTVYSRRNQLLAFARWLHPRALSDATEDDVQVFLDQRDFSARTRYTWLSNLHMFYDFSIRAGVAGHDPTERILRPKLPTRYPRPISDPDLAIGLAMAEPLMRAWLSLAAYAGLRCAEIAQLEREQVIDADGYLRVIGKGNKERIVPLHDEAWAAIRSAGPRRRGPMWRRANGSMFPAARVSRLISVHFSEIGVDATAHQLRHWFGTRTYQQCRDIRIVQELMGHADPTTTAMYISFSQVDAAEAVNGLAVRAA